MSWSTLRVFIKKKIEGFRLCVLDVIDFSSIHRLNRIQRGGRHSHCVSERLPWLFKLRYLLVHVELKGKRSCARQTYATAHCGHFWAIFNPCICLAREAK
jgi:hypothetical protein